MSVLQPRVAPAYGRAFITSVTAALRLALGDESLADAAVLVLDPAGRWQRIAGSMYVTRQDLDLLAADADHEPGPVRDGAGYAFPLRGECRLLGVLVVEAGSGRLDCEAQRRVLDDLAVCLTSLLTAAESRAEAGFVKHSTNAVRRLFVEGARAQDVHEAGTVLARVAAEAFRTERAGMYVVDDDGRICFAVGVGVSDELSDALATSLNGKVAARSPVWQTLEELGGPDLVDDSRTTDVRPGGFVETMAFRSYAAIPLMSGEGPLGMVICGDASRRRTWDARERELANQFALEGALIIDAARLRAAQRQQLALMSHQANHDGLTGLSNRRRLMARLDEALDAARADDSSVALLLLDLNDFKSVNDTLGHRFGDELLREVSARLLRTMRSSDTLARLGGDEFAVVLPGLHGVEQTLAAAARIQSALHEPVILDGMPLNAVASVGIAMFPDQAESTVDLLQHADVAMYAAKRSRVGGAVLYDGKMDSTTVDRLTLYTELRHALAHDELLLHYQPKLDLNRDEVVGVESLVRWQHPRRGLLGPAAFLPLAESSELIHDLTAWVFEHALAQQDAWARQGHRLDLAVNLSARNLLNDDLMAALRDQIRVSGSAGRLVVEVTETAVMNDPERSIRALSTIRDLGVRISMDDFGTGQSSLALLRKLPVDELKIDRQLVSAIDDSTPDQALVDTIVHLGHRLGLKVVAEGIETARALHTLRQLGCDLGQGYFISPPVAASQLVAMLNRSDAFVRSVSA